MNVCIDTNWLYVIRRGCARYVRGLLRGLRELDPPGLHWSELAWQVESFSFQQPARALKSLYRETVWSQAVAPRRIREARADLVHRTGTFLSGLREPAIVSTLHDFAMFHEPHRFRPWSRFLLKRYLPSLAASDACVCISRFTADEAIRFLDIPADRLFVTPLACEFSLEDALRAEQPPPVATPPEFFLFVGALEPGKNLALLRQTYALARSRNIDLPPLAIAGERLLGVEHEGDSPANWVYLGHVSDAQLMYLYRRTLAFVFPTKYEGFGLPALEAMTLGCPVVCSPVASLPEVAGDAALYADQTPESYLDALRQLARDASVRRTLTERGFQQAARFSWRTCAEQTVAAYTEALRRYTPRHR